MAANPFARLRLPYRLKRIRFELPTRARLPEIVEHLNDWKVARWLLNVPHPVTIEGEREWIARAMKGYRSGTDLPLAIIELASDRLIGGTGLHHVSFQHSAGEVGYWLARPYWGRGYGRELLDGMLKVSFRTLGLTRLEAGVFPGNQRSEGLLRSAGFRYEGTRRKAFLRDGNRLDDRFFGLLRDEWERRQTRSGRRLSR